jgi:hypothetical protein
MQFSAWSKHFWQCGNSFSMLTFWNGVSALLRLRKQAILNLNSPNLWKRHSLRWGNFVLSDISLPVTCLSFWMVCLCCLAAASAAACSALLWRCHYSEDTLLNETSMLTSLLFPNSCKEQSENWPGLTQHHKGCLNTMVIKFEFLVLKLQDRETYFTNAPRSCTYWAQI